MTKKIKNIEDIHSRFRAIMTGKQPTKGSINLDSNYFSTHFNREGKKIVKKEIPKQLEEEKKKSTTSPTSVEEDWKKVGERLKELYGEDTQTFSLEDLNKDSLKTIELKLKLKKATTKYKPIVQLEQKKQELKVLKKDNLVKKELPIQEKPKTGPKVNPSPKENNLQEQQKQKPQQQQLEQKKQELKVLKKDNLVKILQPPQKNPEVKPTPKENNLQGQQKQKPQQQQLLLKQLLQFGELLKPSTNDKVVNAINKGVDYLNNYSKIQREKKLGNGTYLENKLFMSLFPLNLLILSGKKLNSTRPREFLRNLKENKVNAVEKKYLGYNPIEYANPFGIYPNGSNYNTPYRSLKNSAFIHLDELADTYIRTYSYLGKQVKNKKLSPNEFYSKLSKLQSQLSAEARLTGKLLNKYMYRNTPKSERTPLFMKDMEDTDYAAMFNSILYKDLPKLEIKELTEKK